jgi:hypothetical protein
MAVLFSIATRSSPLKKVKIVQVDQEQVEDVICDACGHSCHNGSNFEYMTLQNQWGYGSRFDMEVWQAHVCEKCVIERLIPMVSFQTRDYMPISGDPLGGWKPLDWEGREQARLEWENGGRERSLKEQEERLAEGREAMKRIQRAPRPFRGRKDQS